MGCQDKISDRCTTKTNAVCVKYEGTLHADTLLDVEDCHNLEEVIEDINAELDDINTQIDITALGEACIEYTPAGDELSVADVLLEHEAQICALIAATGLNDPEPCPTCVDPCDTTTGVCTNGMVKYTYAAGAFPLTVIGDWLSGVTPADMYSANLVYSATVDGTYKFTVESQSTFTGSDAGKIGVGINSIDPIETANVAGYFSSSLTDGNTNPKTHTFIKTMVKGDIAQVMFKLNTGTLFTVNSAKLIVEKIA